MAINNTTSTYFFFLCIALILHSCGKQEEFTPTTQAPLTEQEINTISFSIDTALVRYISQQPNTLVWTKESHRAVYSYLDSLANTLPFSASSSINLRVLDSSADKRILIGIGGYIYLNRSFLNLFDNETALLGLMNLLGQLSLSEVALNTIVDSIGQSYINDLQIGANINNPSQLYKILCSIHYNSDTTHRILNNSYDHFCSAKNNPALIYNFLNRIVDLEVFTKNFPYLTSQLTPLNEYCPAAKLLTSSDTPFSRFKQALQ